MYVQCRGLGVTLYVEILFLLGTAFPSGKYTAATGEQRAELEHGAT